MYATLLRLGLYLLVIVLGLYVFRESFAEQQFAEMIPGRMLSQALILSIALIVAGAVARVLGKGASAVRKNRCAVCRTPIPSGAIYCRAHLRTILAEEDDRTHATRLKR
jgi:putative copper export protein